MNSKPIEYLENLLALLIGAAVAVAVCGVLL
jgi:hypothetical protein